MVLDAEYGQLPVPQPLHRAVVQVDMRHLKAVLQRVRVNGVTVVLGGDVYPARLQVPDRVVAAAVAEFQFKILPPKGAGNELVPQANAHHRLFTD